MIIFLSKLKGDFILRGLTLTGIYCGAVPNVNREGKQNGFVMVVTDGMGNAWRVNTQAIDERAFGDEIELSIRCRAWNGNIYYDGDIIR